MTALAGRLLSTALCAALQACAGPSPMLLEGPPTQVPDLLPFTDDAARSMNLGLLRDTMLPEHAKEIRVWTGFGTVKPYFMLQFEIGPDRGLKGNLLAYLEKAPLSESFDESVSSVLRAMCTNVQRNKAVESCSTLASRTVRWDGTYRDLTKLGLWTLPDQSELPQPKYIVFDGASIVVELREGKRYRAYQYSNPAFIEGIAAQRAGEMMRAIGEVTRPAWEGALPPD